MKSSWFGLLGAAALAAGCTTPLAVEGAPCPCPHGYVCDPAVSRCVSHVVSEPAPTPPEPDAGRPASDPEATVCVQPGPIFTRPLWARAYANTIQDLLGVTVDTSALPADDDLPEAFAPPPGPFASELATVYLNLADQVAAVALPTLKLPCTPDPPGQNGCARAFVEGFGPRAFRRPLTAREIDAAVDALDEARRGYGPDLGYRRLVQYLLAQDDFYLRKEVGEAPGPRPGLLALTPWEIATRLSYFLWATMPDDELRQVAAAGKLRTKAEVQAQAERMLASPRAEAMIADFHRRWLGLERIRATEKEMMPGFAALREALLTSGQETAILAQWRQRGSQAAMFGGPLVGNRAMSDFYGLSMPAGTGFEALQPLGAQKRFGLLTLPVVMATLTHGDQTSIVQRGSFVLRRFLCTEPPPPPAAVPPVPEPQPAATARERFAQHSMIPTCWVCHGDMDPIGFALENYDGYGRWRELEDGKRIDVSSGPVGNVLGEPFEGPQGLAQLLARREDVSLCIARNWFSHAVGRGYTTTDDCTLKHLERAFQAGDRTLRPLLLAIVRSDAFLTRVP